jgi:hypothetical protein
METPEKPDTQADVALVADRNRAIGTGAPCECGVGGRGRCFPPARKPLRAVPTLPSIAELEQLDLHVVEPDDRPVVVWDFTKRAPTLAAVGLPASDDAEAA